jgi:hypothetical protein
MIFREMPQNAVTDAGCMFPANQIKPILPLDNPINLHMPNTSGHGIGAVGIHTRPSTLACVPAITAIVTASGHYQSSSIATANLQDREDTCTKVLTMLA